MRESRKNPVSLPRYNLCIEMKSPFLSLLFTSQMWKKAQEMTVETADRWEGRTYSHKCKFFSHTYTGQYIDINHFLINFHCTCRFTYVRKDLCAQCNFRARNVGKCWKSSVKHKVDWTADFRQKCSHTEAASIFRNKAKCKPCQAIRSEIIRRAHQY